MSVDDLSARFQLVKVIQNDLLARVRDFRQNGDPSVLPKVSDAERLDNELEGIINAIDGKSDFGSEESIPVSLRRERTRSSLKQYEVAHEEITKGRITPPDISSSSSRSSSRSVTPESRSVDLSFRRVNSSPRRRRLETFRIAPPIEVPTFMEVMKEAISNNVPDNSSIAESDDPATIVSSPEQAVDISLQSLPADENESRQRLPDPVFTLESPRKENGIDDRQRIPTPEPIQVSESPKRRDRARSFGLPPIYTLVENPEGIRLEEEEKPPSIVPEVQIEPESATVVQDDDEILDLTTEYHNLDAAIDPPESLVVEPPVIEKPEAEVIQDEPSRPAVIEADPVMEYISPTPPVSPPPVQMPSPPSRRKGSLLLPPPPTTFSPREIFVPSSPLLKSNERIAPASISKPVIIWPLPQVKLFMITRRGSPPPEG